MKKILFIIVSVFVSVFFCSCNGTSNNENTEFVISDTTYFVTDYLVNDTKVDCYIDSMTIENKMVRIMNGDTVIIKHYDAVGTTITPIRYIEFEDSIHNIYGNDLSNTNFRVKSRPGAYSVLINPKKIYTE